MQAPKSTPTYTAIIHQHTTWRRRNGTRGRDGNLSLYGLASLARCSQGGDLEGKRINKGADSSKGLMLWPRALEGMARTVESPRVGRDA